MEGGVPLVFLRGPAPMFEKPSKRTLEKAENKTAKQLQVVDYQKEILDQLKQSVREKTDETKLKKIKLVTNLWVFFK